MCDVPDHLRWGRPSRKKEGRYTRRVSERCQKRVVARPWRDIEAPAPRIRRLSCEQTRSLASERGHLPAEIREFLVDALESHGDLCGAVCGSVVESESGAGVSAAMKS